MTEKHLLFWMWKFLESVGKQREKDIIEIAKKENWKFSDNPQAGEITVTKALEESYKEYKAVKR